MTLCSRTPCFLTYPSTTIKGVPHIYTGTPRVIKEAASYMFASWFFPTIPLLHTCLFAISGPIESILAVLIGPNLPDVSYFKLTVSVFLLPPPSPHASITNCLLHSCWERPQKGTCILIPSQTYIDPELLR